MIKTGKLIKIGIVVVGLAALPMFLLSKSANTEIKVPLNPDITFGLGSEDSGALIKNAKRGFGVMRKAVSTGTAPTISPSEPPPVGVSGGGSGNNSAQKSANQDCHPSYSDCLPIVEDIDCKGRGEDGPVFVTGPLKVIGEDVYALDDDGDGWACSDLSLEEVNAQEIIDCFGTYCLTEGSVSLPSGFE